MSEENHEFDRRTVLKTLGTTAMVGAGLGAASGSGAARVGDDELARAYAHETRLRFAFDQHGEGVRQTLVNEGFVAEDFDFWSLRFDLDDRVTGLEPTAENRLAGVTAVVEDGTPTAFGMVSTSSDTHEIALFVQPERDEAYALVESRSGDRFVVTESGVTPTGCMYDSCGSCCSAGYKKRKTYRCNPDCTDCYLYSTNCACDVEDAC